MAIAHLFVSLVLSGLQEEQVTQSKHTNHLVHETSPYLLQHAHNPVDWYPWGREALEKSRKEDKPIFLSIGYAACHWCHVMERECFENEAIAAVMNENFINIKVDREERPDLDEIYMSAVQLMTGSGGWPMSVFLTPDLKPFYGGTYFPPDDRFGRPGFPNLVKALARAYRDRRTDVASTSDEVVKRIREMGVAASGDQLPDAGALATAVDQLQRTFDHQYGGFGEAPKFPHSMDIMLLLRAASRQVKIASSTATPLEMAELTLKAMARGGMYDHLGGGFHRYSTDERWLVPHFEKMLYDNALLARAYTEAFQVTRDPFYERVVRETLDYVLREMQDPGGGFYSTQDADSEGEEGKFFVWTQDEIVAQLGDEDGKLFCAYYAVTPGGNFEHANILSTPRVLEDVARELGRPVEACASALTHARAKLYQVRERRVHPPRDEKILTSWNGLMIGALARAHLAFGDPRYLRAARDAARFLMASLRTKDGRYLRTFKDGQAKLNAYLDDHAYLMQGLVDLYQATFEPSYLEEAQRIEGLLAQRFFDAKEGGFFFTSDDHEALIHRSKDPYDGATPSGNSVALIAMLQLYELTADDKLLARVEQTLKLFAPALVTMPRAFPNMLIALDLYLGPRQTLVLIPGGGDPAPLKRIATQSFFPRLVLAGPTTPIATDKTPLDAKPTAYLCESFTCQAPTTDPPTLAAQLRK